MRTIILSAAMMLAATTMSAQTPAHDPSAKLAEVLPADVAERVLARIAQARAVELPAQAVAHRALELAAKGASASEIEARVQSHIGELAAAKAALERAGEDPSDGEVEATAEAMSKGLDGKGVAEVAKSVRDGRSLEVPMHVISALLASETIAGEAVDKVTQALARAASDAELKGMVAERGKPAVTGRDLADTKRPANAGRPASVPANAGAGATPPVSGVPTPPVGSRP